jgi:hypothetical protein
MSAVNRSLLNMQQTPINVLTALTFIVSILSLHGIVCLKLIMIANYNVRQFTQLLKKVSIFKKPGI